MLETIRTTAANTAARGLDLWWTGARDAVKALRMTGYAAHRVVEGNIGPALDATVGMQRHVAEGLLAAVRGDRDLAGVARDAGERVHAGLRFNGLVHTLGRELFGTAKYAGETVLAEDGNYRLVFVPPKAGVPVAPRAVFHGAGGIPYGDQLFRGLPEANFFGVFQDRGVPLYVMELRGDKTVADPARTTMESLVETYERLTAIAFEHNGRRKMVLEGYCGHGLQSWAWVCSHPRQADDRFEVVVSWVAPVDAKECTSVGELSQLCPDALLDATFTTFGRWPGNVPGWSLQTGLDMGLKNLFPKTPFGRFASGWNDPSWRVPTSVGDLSPAQRMQIIGAYWISPENCDRFALPVDLVRYAVAVFTKGVSPAGEIPWKIAGKPLSLKDVAAATKLRVVGIYAGRDLIVPDRTAYVLKGVFGPRYAHVVHPNAGHVSYVFSPRQWDRSFPGRFDPDPIDLMMA